MRHCFMFLLVEAALDAPFPCSSSKKSLRLSTSHSSPLTYLCHSSRSKFSVSLTKSPPDVRQNERECSSKRLMEERWLWADKQPAWSAPRPSRSIRQV